MKNYVAEAFGTFLLVLIGCGTIVLAGAAVGQLGIAFAFGLALITAYYIIGGISGCHINPAVTVGAWAAGRISKTDGIGYIIGQVAGAIIAAFIVMLIAQGKASYGIGDGLGQNGFGTGFLGEYNIVAAVIFEFIATVIFVTLFMEVTEDKSLSRLAGLMIGLALVGIYLVGYQVTGVSVNPARSIGPALFAGPYAWVQLPIFLAAPLAGGLVGGYLSKSKMLSASDKDGEGEKAISDLAGRVKSFSEKATSKVSSKVSGAATSVSGAASSAASSVSGKVSGAATSVSGAASKATASASNMAGDASKTAKDTASAVKDKTTSAASSMSDSVSGATSKASSKASDTVDNVSKTAKDSKKAATTKAKKTVSTAKKTVRKITTKSTAKKK